MASRFELHTPVLVRQGPPEPHCRTPHYLRGKVGIVEELVGTFRDPTKLAFHAPGLPPLRLYRIRFRQADLWPEYGHAPDALFADIYETWLVPCGSEATA